MCYSCDTSDLNDLEEHYLIEEIVYQAEVRGQETFGARCTPGLSSFVAIYSITTCIPHSIQLQRAPIRTLRGFWFRMATIPCHYLFKVPLLLSCSAAPWLAVFVSWLLLTKLKEIRGAPFHFELLAVKPLYGHFILVIRTPFTIWRYILFRLVVDHSP